MSAGAVRTGRHTGGGASRHIGTATGSRGLALHYRGGRIAAHRNIQGLARDPDSGRVWANEHGPRGGDEINLIERAANYGWPRHTFGRDYRTRLPIGEKHVEGIVYPKVVWTPATAPSGLVYYTGDRFPRWRGSLFSGGLASEDIRRIALDRNGNVTGQERLSFEWRIRDVRQGPDGFLYALTDEQNGRLLRIEPQ